MSRPPFNPGPLPLSCVAGEGDGIKEQLSRWRHARGPPPTPPSRLRAQNFFCNSQQSIAFWSAPSPLTHSSTAEIRCETFWFTERIVLVGSPGGRGCPGIFNLRPGARKMISGISFGCLGPLFCPSKDSATRPVPGLGESKNPPPVLPDPDLFSFRPFKCRYL